MTFSQNNRNSFFSKLFLKYNDKKLNKEKRYVKKMEDPINQRNI